MLQKLNDKGMTVIEIIISFSLVAIISISLLNVVMSYKDREETESYKKEILTYKNTVTKDIQDDMTKYVLKSITPIREEYGPLCNHFDSESEESGAKEQSLNHVEYKLTFLLTDEEKTLVIDRLANYISYTENGKEVMYEVPDLGQSGKEKVGRYKCLDVDALRINEIQVKEENNFFILDVNLYHNKIALENKYSIHIVAPINFS